MIIFAVSNCTTDIVLLFFVILISDGDWSVSITTGREQAMATINKVYLTVYGEAGHSKDLLLNNDDREQQFIHGETSEFIVSRVRNSHVSGQNIYLPHHGL